MCWVHRVLFPAEHALRQARRAQWERWKAMTDDHHQALAQLEQALQHDARRLQDPRLWRETHDPLPPRRPR